MWQALAAGIDFDPEGIVMLLAMILHYRDHHAAHLEYILAHHMDWG